MTLLDFITKWAGLGGIGLVSVLEWVRDNVPDMADKANEWLVAFAESKNPAGVLNVVTEVFEEVGDIGSGKIVPKSHSSDAA